MTHDKDRKRIIRNRMKKTGESYTAARAHVISKAGPRSTPEKTAAARSVDYAARSGIADDVIAAKTGHTWREWVHLLDADAAAAMPHRDIAALVHEKHGVGAWWTQTVTVGYERIKGLREIGQRRNGTYEANRSRTFNIPVGALFDAWADEAVRRRWLRGVKPVVRTATRPKSMRLQWPDGTLVVVGFAAKGPAKSMVAVQHTKLPDRTALTSARNYWTEQFQTLASFVGAGGV